jgi:hypothetical protein
MESQDAGLVQGNEGVNTKFGSGLSPNTAPEPTRGDNSPLLPDEVLNSQGGDDNLQGPPETERTRTEVSGKEPEQAFISSDGQVHQIPPELIGPDGKMLPFNERTMAKLRGKYFTVRHIFLKDCGHKMDAINFPKRNCENCYFQWFNHHGELVRVADEFYRQYGKERLIAMRGKKFTVAFLRFMSTVQHFLKEQKLKEQADGNTNQVGEPNSGVSSGREGTEGEAVGGNTSITCA